MAGVVVQVDDVVIGFAAQSVIRRRAATGSYAQTGSARGQYTPGATTDTTISAVMEPLDHRKRQLLPEGIRLRGRYVMWTTADIIADAPTTGATVQVGDVIVYDSRTYQTFADQSWAGNSHGQYRQFILVERTAEP